MQNIVQKMIAAGAGLFLTTTVAVYGDILYSDTTTDTGNSLSFVNGSTVGCEMFMGNSSAFNSLTSFAFEIYSPDATFSGSTVQMQVLMYANNGTPFNGYPTPSTLLYDSGLFPLSTPQQYVGGNAVTLDRKSTRL